MTKFTGIDGSAAFNIEVRKGNRFSVVVYADPAISEKLIVDKRGSVLHLGMKTNFFTFRQSPRAVITMPELESVELSGASTLIAAGFRGGKEFRCDISGASTLEFDITAEEMDLELSGASDLRGVLETGRINLDVSGSSDIELIGLGTFLKADFGGASTGRLKDFRCTEASIEMSGSSDLYLNLNGKLDLDASGASNLYYTGNVELGKIELSGASTMKQL